MNYLDTSLSDGEKVIYRASLSRAWFWSRILLGTLLLPVFGLGLLVWAMIWLKIISTEIGVTSRRVVLKTGLLNRKIDEISLRKIESVHADQSIFARMFDYGTVRVRGTGESNFIIYSIQSPLDFRKFILQAVEDCFESPINRNDRSVNRSDRIAPRFIT